jgi:hypothetical protein
VLDRAAVRPGHGMTAPRSPARGGGALASPSAYVTCGAAYDVTFADPDKAAVAITTADVVAGAVGCGVVGGWVGGGVVGIGVAVGGAVGMAVVGGGVVGIGVTVGGAVVGIGVTGTVGGAVVGVTHRMETPPSLP